MPVSAIPDKAISGNSLPDKAISGNSPPAGVFPRSFLCLGLPEHPLPLRQGDAMRCLLAICADSAKKIFADFGGWRAVTPHWRFRGRVGQGRPPTPTSEILPYHLPWHDSESQKGIGTAALGGMIAETSLSLAIVPMLYYMVETPGGEGRRDKLEPNELG